MPSETCPVLWGLTRPQPKRNTVLMCVMWEASATLTLTITITHRDSDYHKNLIFSSVAQVPSFHRILWKSVE